MPAWTRRCEPSVSHTVISMGLEAIVYIIPEDFALNGCGQGVKRGIRDYEDWLALRQAEGGPQRMSSKWGLRAFSGRSRGAAAGGEAAEGLCRFDLDLSDDDDAEEGMDFGEGRCTIHGCIIQGAMIFIKGIFLKAFCVPNFLSFLAAPAVCTSHCTALRSWAPSHAWLHCGGPGGAEGSR